MSLLVNRIDKNILKKMLKDEPFSRTTLSFYRYVSINDPASLRDTLYKEWESMKCFGRIYVAHEGINAQMSVPEHNWDAFCETLYAHSEFAGVPFKIAVEDNGKSFYKLIVKVREKIVSDGITEPGFDPAKTGEYLDAGGFNTAIDDPNTVVVDMRNHYESEVGRFERAFCPDADTFREELPLVVDHLKGMEEKRVIMYCTGGIRCEKASAYLKFKGFRNVAHLRGGIIQYAREIKEQGLESRFHGVNFVFDERIGERITDEVLATCHQCGSLCDRHVNCKNDDCHLLFIQCDSCSDKMNSCCTARCQDILSLPVEEQRRIRKGRVKNGPECLAVYKSRLRPDLRTILKNELTLK